MAQWKRFEAQAAALFGYHRAWANAGGRFDFPGPEELKEAHVLGQCKNVKNLSLHQLTKLAEEMQEETLKHAKLGVVCTKVRRGRGQESSNLVTMTGDMWWFLINTPWLYEAIRTQIRQSGLTQGDTNGTR